LLIRFIVDVWQVASAWEEADHRAKVCECCAMICIESRAILRMKIFETNAIQLLQVEKKLVEMGVDLESNPSDGGRFRRLHDFFPQARARDAADVTPRCRPQADAVAFHTV
jgi:hypothetical protein